MPIFPVPDSRLQAQTFKLGAEKAYSASAVLLESRPRTIVKLDIVHSGRPIGKYEMKYLIQKQLMCKSAHIPLTIAVHGTASFPFNIRREQNTERTPVL
jgi:hypothetical protein